MKKTYAALLLVFFAMSANGQSNYFRLSGGLGAGGILSFTDVRYGEPSFAIVGNLDYHFTPFITGGLEMQVGTIKGGGEDGNPDIHGRQFKNAYSSFTVNTKVRIGEFTDFYYNDFLNYTKGFYVGLGAGAIRNNLKGTVIRDKIHPDNTTYVFPGVSESVNLHLPFNLGIDFYFPDGWGELRYTLNINYQTSYTFGEGLDGYNDPRSKFMNVAPDMYNFLSIGGKYSFGPKKSTRRNLR